MLAVTAGGDHSAYVLGMIKGIFAQRPSITDWETMAGVSAGALISAQLAQVAPGDRSAFIAKLNQMIQSHENFVKPWSTLGTIANVASAFAWHDSLYKGCLTDVVKEHWGEMQRNLHVGCYNVSRGFYETFDSPTPEQVAASASVPVVFPPVEINGSEYCDGAISHVLPMHALRENVGKMDIDLMLCYPTTHKEYVKACNRMSQYKLIGRIDSSLNESVWNNMNRDLDTMSSLVGQDIRNGGSFKVGEYVLRVYVPTEGMYVDFTQRNFHTLSRMNAHGENVVDSVLKSRDDS